MTPFNNSAWRWPGAALFRRMPKKYGDRIAVEAEVNVSLAERMARMKAVLDGDRQPADGNN
jgi:hypothetical protein